MTGKASKPVAINAVEIFLMDTPFMEGLEPETPAFQGKTVQFRLIFRLCAQDQAVSFGSQAPRHKITD